MHNNELRNLYSSSINKAIRRGLVDVSLDNWKSLYHIDPKYAKFRLLSIAIEDIGVANLNLLLKIIQLLKNKDQDCNELNFLNSIVGEMASSYKDRTQCMIFDILRADIFVTQQFKDDLQFLCDNFYTLSESKLDNGSLELFKSFSRFCLSFPAEMLQIFEFMWKIKGFSYQLFLPYLNLILNQNITDRIKYGKYFAGDSYVYTVDSQTLSGILIDSIDSHTLTGASLIRQWLVSNKSKHSVLSSLTPSIELKFDIFSKVHFELVGSSVNKKLIYDLSIESSKLYEISQFNNLGLTASTYGEIKDEFLENLNEFRGFTKEFCLKEIQLNC